MAARRKWNMQNMCVERISTRVANGQEIVTFTLGCFEFTRPKAELKCIPELFSRVDLAITGGTVRGMRLANKRTAFWMEDAEVQNIQREIAKMMDYMRGQ